MLQSVLSTFFQHRPRRRSARTSTNRPVTNTIAAIARIAPPTSPRILGSFDDETRLLLHCVERICPILRSPRRWLLTELTGLLAVLTVLIWLLTEWSRLRAVIGRRLTELLARCGVGLGGPAVRGLAEPAQDRRPGGLTGACGC